jgi:hypothetical protein
MDSLVPPFSNMAIVWLVLTASAVTFFLTQ